MITELLRLRRGLGFSFTSRYLLAVLLNLPEVMRTRSLGMVDHKWEHSSSTLKVKTQGKHFLVAPDALPLVRELMLKNCYFFDMSKKYGTVVDLGANRGIFSVMAARVSDRVISVECDTESMPFKFAETMKINEIKNTFFVNKIISDSSSGNRVSLNSILADLNIKEISFLKIDIEGAEEVLLGRNLEWLNLTREISLEVHPCFGVDEQTLLAVLKTRGFKVSLYDKDLGLTQKLERNGMGYIRASR